jgi:hypothetical protein
VFQGSSRDLKLVHVVTVLASSLPVDSLMNFIQEFQCRARVPVQGNVLSVGGDAMRTNLITATGLFIFLITILH